MDIKTKTKMPKMVSISLEDLRNCPKLILSHSHWYPVHKVEECGTNEKKPEVKIEVKLKVNQSIKKLHPKKMYQDYQDIEKICVQCKRQFVWSAGEQHFINRLHEEGKIQSVTEPKRCPDCRKQKRERFENRPPQESY